MKTEPIFSTTVSSDFLRGYKDERHRQSYDGVWLCKEWVKRVFSFIYETEESEVGEILSFTINVYKTRKKGTFPVRFLKEKEFPSTRGCNIRLYPRVEEIEINYTCWHIAEKLGLIEKTIYVEFTDVKWD
jgi:hypothetical protein